jgi:hypothetical protein
MKSLAASWTLKIVALAALAASLTAAALLPAWDMPRATASVARDQVEPCADGKPPAPGQRCKGPVDNESGGGGGALTIGVSVLVGLTIAGVAFVVLRRQLRSPPPPPRPRSTPGTGAAS